MFRPASVIVPCPEHSQPSPRWPQSRYRRSRASKKKPAGFSRRFHSHACDSLLPGSATDATTRRSSTCCRSRRATTANRGTAAAQAGRRAHLRAPGATSAGGRRAHAAWRRAAEAIAADTGTSLPGAGAPLPGPLRSANAVTVPVAAAVPIAIAVPAVAVIMKSRAHKDADSRPVGVAVVVVTVAIGVIVAVGIARRDGHAAPRACAASHGEIRATGDPGAATEAHLAPATGAAPGIHGLACRYGADDGILGTWPG